MKRFFIFTYPKLTLYVIGIVLAYFFFQIPAVVEAITSFDLVYLPLFFAGLLYSAGFTTPLATGFLLAIDPHNIYVASAVAAIGASIADLGIFSFVRLSFMGEFKKLERTSFIKHLLNYTKSIDSGVSHFFVYVLACLIIASPLPDELAVAMLAGFTEVHPYGFALISYIGNIVGIYILLSL